MSLLCLKVQIKKDNLRFNFPKTCNYAMNQTSYLGILRLNGQTIHSFNQTQSPTIDIDTNEKLETLQVFWNCTGERTTFFFAK